jgi:hypothetical protein
MLLVCSFPIFLLIVAGCTCLVTALDENLFTIWNESSSAPSIDFNAFQHILGFFDSNNKSIQTDSSPSRGTIKKRTLLFHLFCVWTERQLRMPYVMLRRWDQRIPAPIYVRVLWRYPVLSIWWRIGQILTYQTLDGQNFNTILFGEDAIIKVNRVDFVNSKANEDTSAAITLYRSNVFIWKSLFRNNFGTYNSCINLNNGFLTLEDVILDGNTGRRVC